MRESICRDFFANCHPSIFVIFKKQVIKNDENLKKNKKSTRFIILMKKLCM